MIRYVYNKLNNRVIIILILLILFISHSFLQEIYIYRIISDNIKPKSFLTFGVERPVDDFCCENSYIRWWEKYIYLLDMKRVEFQNWLHETSRQPHITAKQFQKNKMLIYSSILPIKKQAHLFLYSGSQKILSFQQRKNSLLKKLKKYLNSNHFSLVEGMIFGDISTMDRQFKLNLKTIGMLHVVSASGYNISLLLALTSWLFRSFLSRKQWFVTALILIYIYAVMAGWQPSIVRAVLMSSLSLLASFVLYRQYSPLRSLFWTVTIMLAVNFEYLESISFQFSVLSTLGIIIFLTRGKNTQNSSLSFMLSDVLGHNQSSGSSGAYKSAVFTMFKESFLVTLAAQSLVWPVVLIHFGEISIISPVANTFLLWLTPLITGLGLISLLTSMLSGLVLGRRIATISSLFTWISAYFFEISSSFLGKFEWGLIVIEDKISWWVAIIWWFVLLLFVFLKNRKSQTTHVTQIF